MPTPFVHRFDASTGIVTVSGDLHGIAVRELQSVLVEHLGDRVDLWLDLSEVTLLPSEAIGVIVRAQHAASQQGGVLRLRSAEGTISRRVLEICGLHVTS